MKKILSALAFFAGIVWAQPSESDFAQWPRSYYASIGIGIMANRGDFFSRELKITDKEGNTEIVNFPQNKILLTPDYNLGVNIREFSFGFSFQYWSTTGSIESNPEEFNEQDMSYWRFGLEATYNFFFPEYFQVGVGLGYSFSSMNIEKNTLNNGKLFDSSLKGSAVAIIANIRYYITDYFCLSPSLRFYENWYKSVHTDNSGTIEFGKKNNGVKDHNSYFWQTYIAMSINAIVQF
ncbi:MAG: hypothetical protein IJM92_19615 [Fibrobacter sp.]|uniref:outer membrane beta-barrel protein n=1 Tax=Fibrobacter sp. TaxID=35828 RepID=UPI0025BC869F|nr:outer membrane beta-barrel protein [Fibrobacter sp.]MBQ7081823.1 hypothetical protein [Fibrobacter sp.]